MKYQFKIDLSRYSSKFPFGLYIAQRRWHTWFTGRVGWREVDIFQDREEAIELHEKLKTLPEYLPIVVTA